MRFIKKGIALLLLAIPACVLAQPGLGTEQVEVIKDFEARLLNTEKN
jgi:hypothetical protein